MTRVHLETMAAASERLSWQEWVLQCAEQCTAAHLSTRTGALAACCCRSPLAPARWPLPSTQRPPVPNQCASSRPALAAPAAPALCPRFWSLIKCSPVAPAAPYAGPFAGAFTESLLVILAVALSSHPRRLLPVPPSSSESDTLCPEIQAPCQICSLVYPRQHHRLAPPQAPGTGAYLQQQPRMPLRRHALEAATRPAAMHSLARTPGGRPARGGRRARRRGVQQELY